MFRYLLLATLLSTLPAHAEIYRWVDENGQTVYSQVAPADRDADEIKPAPPPSDNPESVSKEIDQLQQQNDDYLEDRELAKEKRKKDKAAQQIRKDNCIKARNNYASLETATRRLIRMPDGEYRRLKEEERQKMMRQAQDDMDKYCN